MYKLIFFFLFPIGSVAQSVEDSEDVHADPRVQVKDSEVPGKEARQGFPDEQEIEVLPEVPQLGLSRDAQLLSVPGTFGRVLRTIKKGTLLQKVDEIRGYYLACISGTCGYIKMDAVNTVKSGS